MLNSKLAEWASRLPGRRNLYITLHRHQPIDGLELHAIAFISVRDGSGYSVDLRLDSDGESLICCTHSDDRGLEDASLIDGQVEGVTLFTYAGKEIGISICFSTGREIQIFNNGDQFAYAVDHTLAPARDAEVHGIRWTLGGHPSTS